MAQNITLLGASYSDVPSVELPKTGGGTALFADASPTTAVESDVAIGKIFVKVDGSLGTGTASGGGGGSWIKDDGKTYLHITLNSDYYLTIYMAFAQTIAGGNTIDWGDGTTETPTNTSTSALPHTYSEQGDYVISVTNTSGYFWFGYESTINSYIFGDGNNVSNMKQYHFANILRKLELGQGWKADKGRQFCMCGSLTDVYISKKPDGTQLGGWVFAQCGALSSFAWAEGAMDSITTAGQYAFRYCEALPEAVVFPNMTSIPNYYMPQVSTEISALTKISLHEGITSIGGNAFQNCRSVFEITIPSTVTSIGSDAFSTNYGCHAVHLKPTTPPTLSNSNAFSTNNANSYARVMYVPRGSLSAYQSASNWSAYASYMQEEPS